MASPEALTVLVDMDGVLANFDASVQQYLATHHPDITPQPRQNFRIAHDYPEHYQIIRDISDQPNFFAELPIIDHALEGWQRLLDLGYHPQICSSPILTNNFSTAEKLQWLGKHVVPAFGPMVVEEAIITREKYRADGIALIDDKPEIEEADQAVWQHIIFDHVYNRHTAQPRLHGWLDPKLGELLGEAAEHYRAA